MSRRYMPPPSPGEWCDTPDAYRDWEQDIARAQDHEDLHQPDTRDEDS